MAERVCPWWMGYLLANPLRRLYQNPEKILAPYIKSGMTVLDLGPGMGYFSLPMARMGRMLGNGGSIVCVDLQEKMLKSLSRRAKRAGLSERIITRVASLESLNISDFDGKIDFVLAFAVIHEIPDTERLFRELYQATKTGAQILIAEPSGHVTYESFGKMLETAINVGFEQVSTPSIRGSISVLLKK
jgi:ubiquinone/menaquinone biosynthesis C-methylase UbiE